MTGGRPAAPLVAATLAVTLWGLTPVATKVAVDAVDPIVVGILRMTIAGLIAWPAILLLRASPPKTRRLLVLLAISTVTGMIAFPLLFNVGQRLTSASHAALILAALLWITDHYGLLIGSGALLLVALGSIPGIVALREPWRQAERSGKARLVALGRETGSVRPPA